jgi:hypothetical protein
MEKKQFLECVVSRELHSIEIDAQSPGRQEAAPTNHGAIQVPGDQLR